MSMEGGNLRGHSPAKPGPAALHLPLPRSDGYKVRAWEEELIRPALCPLVLGRNLCPAFSYLSPFRGPPACQGWRSIIQCWGGSTHRASPATKDENKSTKTWSAWGGKVADLSKEKGQEPFPEWAFIGFNLHRNTGKAHQSLSGSKDQTIDNKQRTTRAYSEWGSVS